MFNDLEVSSSDTDADWVRGRLVVLDTFLTKRPLKEGRISSLLRSDLFHVIANGWILLTVVRILSSWHMLIAWLTSCVYVWYFATYISRMLSRAIRTSSIIWLTAKPQRFTYLKENRLVVIELVLLTLTLLVSLLAIFYKP